MYQVSHAILNERNRVANGFQVKYILLLNHHATTLTIKADRQTELDADCKVRTSNRLAERYRPFIHIVRSDIHESLYLIA